MVRKNEAFFKSVKEENRFPQGAKRPEGKVEAAIRRVHRKNAGFTLPILRHRNRAKVANFLLKSAFRSTRRSFHIARTVQKARLSARRRFFTGDDVKRAVEGTSLRLRRMRHGR